MGLENVYDEGNEHGNWMEGEFDGDPAAFCKDENSLNAWALCGGWEGIDDLLKDTGREKEDFIGHWFLLIGSLEGYYNLYHFSEDDE